MSQIRTLRKKNRELRKGLLEAKKTISTARDDGYADDLQLRKLRNEKSGLERQKENLQSQNVKLLSTLRILSGNADDDSKAQVLMDLFSPDVQFERKRLKEAIDNPNQHQPHYFPSNIGDIY